MAGLRLREAILILSLLYSAKAWSGVTVKLLKRLTGSHSKCPSEFHHLETGTWKLCHHLKYLRLMYHHEILIIEDTETMKKYLFEKKEECVKDGWYQLLKTDFQFIEQDMKEGEIRSIPKSEYKKTIKCLINQVSLKSLLPVKETHFKLNDISNKRIEIQPIFVFIS